MDDYYNLSLNIKSEALEKMLQNDDCKVVVDYCSEKLLKMIEEQVLKGMDLRGLYIAHSVFSDKIREVIKCEVGNYLRCYDYEVRNMIQKEINQYLPNYIKSTVASALEKQKQKILENLTS